MRSAERRISTWRLKAQLLRLQNVDQKSRRFTPQKKEPSELENKKTQNQKNKVLPEQSFTSNQYQRGVAVIPVTYDNEFIFFSRPGLNGSQNENANKYEGICFPGSADIQQVTDPAKRNLLLFIYCFLGAKPSVALAASMSEIVTGAVNKSDRSLRAAAKREVQEEIFSDLDPNMFATDETFYVQQQRSGIDTSFAVASHLWHVTVSELEQLQRRTDVVKTQKVSADQVLTFLLANANQLRPSTIQAVAQHVLAQYIQVPIRLS